MLRVCWGGWLLVAIAAGSTGAEEGDDYRLVWADEFDENGPPNPANWSFERGFVRNEELQWYQSENAFCENGHLVIEARREKLDNPRHEAESRHWGRRRPHAEYTSASVITRGRQEWRYGRFVMRGRIDTQPGMWPAFWTLGSARDWPGCGEIDIMEYYDGKLLANACWQGRRETKWDATEKPISTFEDVAWSEKFHEWRMDWDRDSIRLYVDDELLNEIDVATANNASRDQAYPFREPHYLLLNLAIGGTRGGDPSQSEFPARFEIDYVRVYQKADSAVGNE